MEKKLAEPQHLSQPLPAHTHPNHSVSSGKPTLPGHVQTILCGGEVTESLTSFPRIHLTSTRASSFVVLPKETSRTSPQNLPVA